MGQRSDANQGASSVLYGLLRARRLLPGALLGAYLGTGFLITAACSPAATPEAASPEAQPDTGSAASAGPGPGSGAGSTASPEEPSDAAAVAKGGTPPDFELDRLGGGSFRLSERLGKDVILLDFWATYCDPCLAAMPHLNDLYLKNKERGFLVLGVAIDGPGSSAEIHSTVQRLGVEFPILLDTDSRVVAQYNPRVSAPYSVLIGRDGRVLARQEGYTSGKGKALAENVERALGSGQ